MSQFQGMLKFARRSNNVFQTFASLVDISAASISFARRVCYDATFGYTDQPQEFAFCLDIATPDACALWDMLGHEAVKSMWIESERIRHLCSEALFFFLILCILHIFNGDFILVFAQFVQPILLPALVFLLGDNLARFGIKDEHLALATVFL